VLMADDLPPL